MKNWLKTGVRLTCYPKNIFDTMVDTIEESVEWKQERHPNHIHLQCRSWTCSSWFLPRFRFCSEEMFLEVFFNCIRIPPTDANFNFIIITLRIYHLNDRISTTNILNNQVREWSRLVRFDERLYLRVMTQFSSTHFEPGCRVFFHLRVRYLAGRATLETIRCKFRKIKLRQFFTSGTVKGRFRESKWTALLLWQRFSIDGQYLDLWFDM